MIRICAWCKASLGTKEDGQEKQTVTHGICDDCERKMELEAKAPSKKSEIRERN